MSAPFRNQIRLLIQEAEELLEDPKSFVLPVQTGSISRFHAQIRSLITSLDSESQIVTELFDNITNENDRWMATRTSMTGAERLADNPIYDEFVTDVPYPTTLRKLMKYNRKLHSERGTLSASLPDPSQTTDTLFHLPKLSLPKFSGKCVEFTSFWNAFRVGVHDLTNISDSVKFNYLKECLEGPPLLLVKSLPLTEASYHEAIRLIHENFGNVDEINRTLHHAIRKLPVVHSVNGPEILCTELRSFVDQFESLYLQMLEQHFDVNTLPVQMELESKLPPQILEEVFRDKEIHGQDWNTDQLRNTLKSILKRKEGVKALRDQKKELNTQDRPSNSPKQFRQVGNFRSPNMPQSSLTFSTSRPNNRPGMYKFPCVFCNHPNHLSHLCSNYNTLQTRKSRLREKKLCFTCYKPDHLARSCQNPITCTNCRNLHPRALCPNPFNSLQEPPPQHVTNFCSQMISDATPSIRPIPLSLIKFPEDFNSPTSHNNSMETKTELVTLNEINPGIKSLPIPDKPLLIHNSIKNCTQLDNNQTQLPSPDSRTNSCNSPTTANTKLKNNNEINSIHTPTNAMKAMKINRVKPETSVPTDNTPTWTLQNESSGPPGDVPSVKSPSPTATKIDYSDPLAQSPTVNQQQQPPEIDVKDIPLTTSPPKESVPPKEQAQTIPNHKARTHRITVKKKCGKKWVESTKFPRNSMNEKTKIVTKPIPLNDIKFYYIPLIRSHSTYSQSCTGVIPQLPSISLIPVINPNFFSVVFLPHHQINGLIFPSL
uniref:CCHC-type domain-containing protein n=1 Tax=Meloidogyne enterolobii TaxID=390850 RepID=A0A6V7Y707_MELEN|nr:unnamed protein product [Meloidogyne enterolobii]